MPGEDQDVSGQASIVSGASAKLSLWHWFSSDQAVSAVVFCRRAGDLESNPTPPTDDERHSLGWSEEGARQHRSAVIAALLASVACIEASRHGLSAKARQRRAAAVAVEVQLEAERRYFPGVP
jgi:hypothetical protein